MQFFRAVVISILYFLLVSCGDRHVFINMSDKSLDKVATAHLSFPEAWGRWTDGSPVQFKFIEGLPKNFKLTIKTTGTFGPMVGKTIDVVLTGAKQQFVATAEKQNIEMTFINVSPEMDTIILMLPESPSPKDLGLSEDVRNLGIGIISLEIKPI